MTSLSQLYEPYQVEVMQPQVADSNPHTDHAQQQSTPDAHTLSLENQSSFAAPKVTPQSDAQVSKTAKFRQRNKKALSLIESVILIQRSYRAMKQRT